MLALRGVRRGPREIAPQRMRLLSHASFARVKGHASRTPFVAPSKIPLLILREATTAGAIVHQI